MKKYLIFMLAVINVISLNAEHLLGGDLSYKCLGININNQNLIDYEITLNIYKDCNTGSAQFDNPIFISIYQQNEDSAILVVDTFAFISNITNIEPPEYDCLINDPNICMEQASYRIIISLEIINSIYTIVSQRCCRSNKISNILTPEITGVTYSIEITPLSQQLLNSSPEFNTLPPLLFCINESIDYQYIAVDLDGDQLIYSFCSPLNGGGLFGPAISCSGITPKPACPPPYGQIQFISPDYSYQTPLGGSPPISINSIDGILNGIPTSIGDYTGSVCITEVRNGEILSTVRQDFQFTMINCSPKVSASVQSNQVPGENEFIIESCDNLELTLLNKSTQQSYINEVQWLIDLTDSIYFSNSWDLEIKFSQSGLYTGLLIINPEQACTDTAFLNFIVADDVHADFSYFYDTCIAGDVKFNNLSNSLNGVIEKYKWEFGDGNSSLLTSPSHQYDIPNNFYVSLEAFDISGCSDTVYKFLEWKPAPAIILIDPSEKEGCVPLQVIYNNLSSPIDSTYQITWKFSNGETSKVISPTHTYSNPGLHSVSLEIISPIGCVVSKEYKNLIKALPHPESEFEINIIETMRLENKVNFINKSQYGELHNWFLDDKLFSTDKNPTHLFSDTGNYEISLIVNNKIGCTDTVTKNLYLSLPNSFYIPNAFSPNNDGINDSFSGKGYVNNLKTFTLNIWNRWGELVFFTSNPFFKWNGTIQNTGRICPPGIYTFNLDMVDQFNKRINNKGSIALIR